jgi:hypothetical protein
MQIGLRYWKYIHEYGVEKQNKTLKKTQIQKNQLSMPLYLGMK